MQSDDDVFVCVCVCVCVCVVFLCRRLGFILKILND